MAASFNVRTDVHPRGEQFGIADGEPYVVFDLNNTPACRRYVASAMAYFWANSGRKSDTLRVSKTTLRDYGVALILAGIEAIHPSAKTTEDIERDRQVGGWLAFQAAPELFADKPPKPNHAPTLLWGNPVKRSAAGLLIPESIFAPKK